MKNYFQIQFQVEKEKILVLSNVETVHVEDFGPKQPMPTAANVPVRSGSLNVRFFRDVWWWINPEFRAIFKNVKIFEIGAKFSLLAPLESQCWKRSRFAQCPVFSRCLMTNQSRISCHFQKGKNLWNWSEIHPVSTALVPMLETVPVRSMSGFFEMYDDESIPNFMPFLKI